MSSTDFQLVRPSVNIFSLDNIVKFVKFVGVNIFVATLTVMVVALLAMVGAALGLSVESYMSVSVLMLVGVMASVSMSVLTLTLFEYLDGCHRKPLDF